MRDLLARLDGVLPALLSPTLRLAIWGGALAVVSMGLYWLVSPQSRIGRIAATQRALQRDLWDRDASLAEGMSMSARMLRLALLRLLLVLVPVVVAAVPVVLTYDWLDATYSGTVPVPGFAAGLIDSIHGWALPFFAALLAFSLFLKLAFRIR